MALDVVGSFVTRVTGFPDRNRTDAQRRRELSMFRECAANSSRTSATRASPRPIRRAENRRDERRSQVRTMRTGGETSKRDRPEAGLPRTAHRDRKALKGTKTSGEAPDRAKVRRSGRS
jgi:hypothetical protein